MLDLHELSDGAKDSIMMTMDELQRTYESKVAKFHEQHMDEDIFNDELN